MITADRRENVCEPMRNMFKSIKNVDEHSDIKVIYPVHMNPVIREDFNKVLGNRNRIKIFEPLEVLDLHNFSVKSYLILTDSGGIHEEAPSLGRLILVMRDTAERLEGVMAIILKLVDTEEDEIYRNFKLLLVDKKEYKIMSKANNPYGMGYLVKELQILLKDIK